VSFFAVIPYAVLVSILRPINIYVGFGAFLVSIPSAYGTCRRVFYKVVYDISPVELAKRELELTGLNMPFCPKCGKKVSPEANYCLSCGASLGDGKDLLPHACWLHPQVDAVAMCKSCGKGLCKDCVITIQGQSCCKECIEKGVVTPRVTTVPEPIPTPTRVGRGLFEASGIVLEEHERIIKRGRFSGKVPRETRFEISGAFLSDKVKVKVKWKEREGELILTNKRLIAVPRQLEPLVGLELEDLFGLGSRGDNRLQLSLKLGALGTERIEKMVLKVDGASEWENAIRSQLSARAHSLESLNQGHKEDEAEKFAELGMQAHESGDYDKAENFYKEALWILERVGDQEGQSAILIWLGNLAKDRGRFDEAESYYKKTLEMYQRRGDQESASRLTTILNVLAMQRARLDSSQKSHIESDVVEKVRNSIESLKNLAEEQYECQDKTTRTIELESKARQLIEKLAIMSDKDYDKVIEEGPLLYLDLSRIIDSFIDSNRPKIGASLAKFAVEMFISREGIRCVSDAVSLLRHVGEALFRVMEFSTAYDIFMNGLTISKDMLETADERRDQESHAYWMVKVEDFTYWVRSCKFCTDKKISEDNILPLVTLLQNGEREERIVAARALGGIPKMNSVVHTLVECLEDKESLVRREIIDALYNIGDKSVVPSVVKCLSDKDDLVRLSAVLLLGGLGDARMIPLLEKMRKTEDKDMQESIDDAIEEIKWREGEEANS
jgi:tetratricopeptide (TPR) repeat protein